MYVFFYFARKLGLMNYHQCCLPLLFWEIWQNHMFTAPPSIRPLIPPPQFVRPRQNIGSVLVYRDKGTPPKNGGGSSFTVTKLPSSLEPKGQRPLSLLHSP